MYDAIAPHVRRLLEQSDVRLTFVDIGARNGVLELRSFPERVDAYGFEPNPAEYDKLVSGKTDASLIGAVPPDFHSLTYFPYAVSDRDGKATLYVTNAPAATGLLPPNTQRLEEIVWKGFTFRPNFAVEFFQVEREVEVDVRTLATLARENSIDHVDYLKVDVEGSEYEVLDGAGDLLDRTGVIRVEVCFIPFRRGQKLFSEVDILLRKHGFDLIRYEIVPEQVGYKARQTPSVFGPSIGYPDRYGQPLSGDAIYVNREIADPQRAIAQAAVLIDKNYLDEALFVLRRRTDVDDPELLHLLETYRHVRLQHRLALAARSVFQTASLLRRPVHSFRVKRAWRRIEQMHTEGLDRGGSGT